MTRKHFRLIAATIATVTNYAERVSQAKAMASMCAAANPRFNSSVWYNACGVKMEDV